MSAAAATADASEAPKKKSKKLLFIILGVVVLALIGAGAALFILKKNTAEGEEGDEDAPAVVEHSKPKTPPTFLPMENMVINLADLVFAVDSVPAVFAITTDTFIVYTSNIFAILGLRALFFALAAVLQPEPSAEC